MKLKTMIVAMLASLSVHAEDMRKYTRDTQALVKQGKYQEALERHLWYHDHALEHDCGQRGVRLSFALSYWKQLGDKYPPALEAMKKVRDDKTALLEGGNGSYDLFVDVHALNRVLEEDSKTVELFRKLDQEQSALAVKCWDIVDEQIIKEKAYDLARKYMKNYVSEFEKIEAEYTKLIPMYGINNSGDGIKKINEKKFVDASVLLIDLALSLGDVTEAKEIQKKALAVLDDPRLRDAIPSDEIKQDAQQ